MAETYKSCTVCKESLPLSQYHTSTHSRDGRQSACRPCTSVRRRRAREALRANPVDPPESKTCPICEQVKPGAEFYRDRNSGDGASGYCRVCTVARHHAWRADRRARDTIPIPESKPCPKCRVTKSASEFALDRSKTDGLATHCRSCRSAASRARKYGMSEAQYRELMIKQSNSCGICQKTGPLCVDHDHETGEVRGLLCTPCNVAVGILGDSVDSLQRALNYLSP